MRIRITAPPILYVIVAETSEGNHAPMLTTDEAGEAYASMNGILAVRGQSVRTWAVGSDGKTILLGHATRNADGGITTHSIADGGSSELLHGARDTARTVYMAGSPVWGPPSF